MACVVMAVDHHDVARSSARSSARRRTRRPRPMCRAPSGTSSSCSRSLRVIKPPSLVPLATIGVPTLGMILLFLLPFYDRGPERRPERRPIATITGIVVIGAMAFLTYPGANAGSPTAIEMATPRPCPAGRRGDARRIRSRQEGGRSVGLPCLSQDRRQRQQRPRAGTDAHRLAPARPGDRPHAGEPDGADAFVQEPAAAEVQRGRRLPLAAEVARPCR